MISVIIPAHNEETCLPGAIRSVRETAGEHPVEVIVVDGNSSDRTRQIAGALADRVLSSPKPGRGTQMRLGAQAAGGDPILFLHADTRLPPNWLEVIRNAFLKNPRPAAAAFRLKFDSQKFSYKIIQTLSGLRARFTGVPQGDQALAVARDAYFKAGGFPDAPLMEEYLLIPKLRRLGRIEMFDENVLTSPRKYEKKGPIRNALKNSLFILLFYLGVSPQKLAEWYRWR